MLIHRNSVMLSVVLAGAIAGSSAAAADGYAVTQVRSLKLTEGQLPAETDLTFDFRDRQQLAAMRPYAVLEGEGEAYVTHVTDTATGRYFDGTLSVRSPGEKDVRGRLFWPKPDASGLVALAFVIPKDQLLAERKIDFLRNKLAHYDWLMGMDIPGSAWFRHQSAELRSVLGQPADSQDRARRFFGRRSSSLEDTYALVSGGRALSENLQLDRLLPESKVGIETVSLKSIEGISVRAFDWAPLVKDKQPANDSLAALIPEDQHVLFFPSFQAMVRVADEALDNGVPVLNIAEPRAEDARSQERYEQQLGISLTAGARLLGGQLIKSVAMTGADPYLRTGADVALLFEPVNAAALKQVLQAQINVAVRGVEGVEAVEGEYKGVRYSGFRSPDRIVSSYLAQLDSTIVVTNSTAQLERLVDVVQGRVPSIASLDEYTFFRDRYPLGGDEAGLLVISDATIRRWCGPQWRIGTSRRTRAVAVMTEIQARHLDGLVGGSVRTGPVYAGELEAASGRLELASSGVISQDFGTLAFQTPILEMDLDLVTRQEAELYERWRDGYQRRWSNFFDPIAVQFKLADDRIAADMTVMPLITGSNYRQLIDASRGGAIAADTGDPHPGTLLHIALALNRDSDTIKNYTNLLAGMTGSVRLDPLSWIGETIAVYVDEDPVWDEMARAEELDEFIENEFYRFPIGLYVQVQSGFKLTLFLTGLRTFIDQSSPGMTVWETLEHNEQPYVRVAPSERAKSRNRDQSWDRAALYYAATGQSLIVSLNEGLVQRALDREAKRLPPPDNAATTPIKEVPDEPEADLKVLPWLGKNFCVQVAPSLKTFLVNVYADEYQRQNQRLAWSNLHILNEWKSRYPDQDPLAVHERFWQRRLRCPGGGEYQWNPRWHTMESTVYGHPGEPREGPRFPAALDVITRANFGLTFEDDGLRTVIEIERKP